DHGLIAEDHVKGDPEVEQVVVAADREFRGQAGPQTIIHLETGSRRKGQFVMAAHAPGAEVEQVPALEREVAGVTGLGEVEPVQLHEGEYRPQIAIIEVQVKTVEDVVAPRAV